MFSLNAIRIENLRSLADTGFISLKPITVLVGKNSAGKSTFARFFPLLKQSIQERKRAPVLWFGRLVDFGSFDEALSRNQSEDEIRFSFRLTYSVDANSVRRRRVSRQSVLNLVGSGHIDITLALRKGKNGTYPDRIVINTFGREYQVVINENNKIEKIKGPALEWESSGEIQGWAQADKLFPQILLLKKHSSENYFQEFSPFWKHLEDAVRIFVHGNTTNTTITRIAERIPVGRPADVLEHIRRISAPASWSEGISACSANSKSFERIYDAAFLDQIPQLLDEINTALEKDISKSSYLEPIRATAQRYYRQQELAVEEIDSKGANIAVFLEGLSDHKKEAFSSWLGEHLGFSVSSIKEGGHISLKLKPLDGEVATNIADMGFGFSQVLPIVAQLWPSMHERKDFRYGNSERQFVIIEQPELHLHPDFQAKLADIFAKSISREKGDGDKNYRQLHIMAETHSPSLINRLGQLVAAGKINKDDVQVVLFEQTDSSDMTAVKTSSFDDQGLLIDWPFGFFEPDFES